MEACHVILSNISDGSIRTDVLCPGAMDLQGPHVSVVDYSMCINLNIDLSKQHTSNNTQV